MAFRIAPITPWQWPQDDLQIPNGFGAMPDVNRENERFTKRDSFVYTMTKRGVSNGQAFTLIAPTEADGDFWCKGMTYIPVCVQDGRRVSLALKLNIIDIKTGLDLTYPYSRATVYRQARPFAKGNYVAQAKGLYRSNSEFIEPYCFTRSGGIKLIAEMDIPTEDIYTFDLFFAFTGWKEYSNAAS